MYLNECEIKVRYVETDQMGVVHHSNYYHWFEEARGDFLSVTGYTYADIENEGLLFPLVESNCKYIVGAKYGDTVIIQTWISELGKAKMAFEYNVIRKSDNKIISKGKTVHGFVNKDFRIININKILPDLYNKLQELI
jgi:acyl-CoA thioester hydrolase